MTKTTLFAAIALGWLVIGIQDGAVAQDVTINLRPGMPSLKSLGVPTLYKITDPKADADRMDKGLKIEPEVPYRWIASPGETFTVTVSTGVKDAGDRIVLTVWDWRNRAVAQRRFGAAVSGKVHFKVEGNGTYLLTLDRFAGDKHISRLPRSFSVCPPNNGRIREWNTDHFFIGTCSYPDRQQWRNDFGTMHPEGLTPKQSAELEAELSARLGVQVTRMNAGSEDDFRMYDSRGIRPHLQLSHGKGDVLAKYANVSDPKWRYPREEASSREWFADIAKRFGKRAFSFEVYNEPDNRGFWRGAPEEFIAASNWAFEAFRKYAPDAIIMNGGYTLIERDTYLKYVQSFKGKTTWVAFHTHNTLPHCMKLFKEHVRLHQEAGYENPVFVNTEMGVCAWRLDRDYQMAAAAIQKILYFWSHGVRGVLMYRARDRGGPRLTFKGWGYLDHFFCPRFKYGAVAALINSYTGAKFESILIESPSVHAYTFIAKGKRLVAVFDPRDKTEPSDVVLKGDADSAFLLDPMGNPAAVDDPKRVVVTAGLYPVTVVFEGASSVKLGEKGERSEWVSLFDGKTLGNWRSSEFGGDGEITVKDGAIYMEMGSDLTGVTWKGEPPARINYEIALEAQRVYGNDFFCGLTFPVGNDPCTLILGGWGGGVTGLSSLDDDDASLNETSQWINYKEGRWYRIRLRVTRKSISAWLDDEQIINANTAGRKISIRPEVELSKPLGVACWQTGAAIRNIRLRKLGD